MIQPLLYRQGPKIPVSRRDWPPTVSLIYARRQNPSLPGDTGLIHPLLYRQGPKIPVSPATLASYGLSYIGEAPKSQSRLRDWPHRSSLMHARPQNPSLAGETGLKKPLLYRQGPQIPVSPARLASNSLSDIGKAPESQSRRRDWPHTASLIEARPHNPSVVGETGLIQPLLYRQGPEIPVSPARLA